MQWRRRREGAFRGASRVAFIPSVRMIRPPFRRSTAPVACLARGRALAVRTSSRGLTLVEMLIAMAITLLMMGAVVNVFANISAGVRDRKAMIELGAQLRNARELLNRDLQGATCNGLTWQRPDEGTGYIEIIEGVRSDFDPSELISAGAIQNDSLVPNSQIGPDAMALGDWDDVLALTVRSSGEPFRGRGPGGQIVESQLAEVVWFPAGAANSRNDRQPPGPPGEPGMRRIYRRTLLIAPWVDVSFAAAVNFPEGFYHDFDISARFEPIQNKIVSTTLG